MQTALKLLLAAAALVFAPVSVPAVAQDSMGPMVAVPAPGGGGGGGVSGCYRISGTIYGPYRMQFCLNPKGSGNYQVNGGGLNCSGGLDWYNRNNGRVDIDLYRSQCGRGTQWTGDALACRIPGWRPLGNKGPTVAVPVPGGGGVNSLNCRYNPMAGGYQPIQVTANRM
jgi:hypothetical protein